MDRDTNRAKGFAFVTFQNAEDAIDGLNDTEFGGRNIKVNKTRPGGGGGGRDYNCDRGGSYRGGGGRNYSDSYGGGGRYGQQRRY